MSAPPGSFQYFFSLSGTAVALRNFLALTTLGGSTRVFQEIRDLLVSGSLGDLEKLRDPKQAKKSRKVNFPGLGVCFVPNARLPNLIAC